MSKALLIKSYTTITTGTQGQWNKMDQAASYIKGIQTGGVAEDANAEVISAMISGVPTPWARTRLFRFALESVSNNSSSNSNSALNQYYAILHNEWRGLLALMATRPNYVRISKRLEMNAKGEDYNNISSAFGRMLFDDKDIWSDLDELQKNPDAQPFIQLIYYKDQLVGGTSPFTGVFTGADYSKLEGIDEVKWYRNGKFENPTDFDLSSEELQKIYLFVKNLGNNLQGFEQKINQLREEDNRVDLKGLKNSIGQWLKELKGKAGSGTLKDKGSISRFSGFDGAFKNLFSCDIPVYLKPDYTFTYVSGEENILIGDIENILSKDSYVLGWGEDASANPKLSESPIYYLQIEDLKSGTKCYFSVPLSEMGIDVFKNRLGELLEYNTGGKSRINAQMRDGGNILTVSMTLEIDGEETTLNTKDYQIEWMTDMGHVILWPNFVSDNWNKYYLYNEFTSESKNRFYPIFKYNNNIVRDGKGNFLTQRYKPDATEELNVEIKQLIKYPAGKVEGLPKYDIISADKPIEGLIATIQVGGHEENAGFLMLRHSIIKNLTSNDTNSTAVVGIDFGSNNTCVYYNSNDKGPKPVEFENNRAMLVGQENNNRKANAGNDELLFFTNYPADNGQLKSWLHEHDSNYNVFNESMEVAGGVPVNRPNVVVKEMNEYEIKTQAGTLHYNMKWLDDSKGLKKKGAYLKSIWLQTCAFLYKNRITPREISWSHPGSMMEADVNDYDKIFNDLPKIFPITNCKKPVINDSYPTEAEAVCSYALSQNFGLKSDNLFLGIDVGGSTSDILILGKEIGNQNKNTLFRESSVRLAAGVFFNAVIKSDSFRRALVNYHEGPQKTVYVSNIADVLKESSKAPYYLNNIFDQLKTEEDYETFYNSIDGNAKFVFTIPAYVTGLLLFYSGMLIGKTIKDSNLENIKRVEILSFGKGGRLFHWLLKTAPKATKEYYATCLNTGVKCIANIVLEVKYRDEIAVENKAEVAIGLCNPKEVEIKHMGEESDICGEKGVKFVKDDGSMESLETDTELTGDRFVNDMNRFDFSSTENFKNFMEIFINFVSQKTKLYDNAQELRDEINDLSGRVASYIVNNDSEYKKAKEKAKSGGSFNYHQPIIVAEGICFINTLIRQAFNQ